MDNIEEWPNFPDDYLESRKHDIHVHLQILRREIDEVHEYLAHYQEPWISEGQLRKAVATWKKEDPRSWRTIEELETQNMIEAMKSPAYKHDLESTMLNKAQTAAEDHHMQKTLRTRHIGLGRTMSSSANKNHKNQGSSVPRSLSLKKPSILETTANSQAYTSHDVIKSQFAKHDFVHKTHYKSPEILSPGSKRLNISGSSSPKTTSSDENGKRGPGYSRENTEQSVANRTTFIPSGMVTPGEAVSDTIKTQFASMSAYYKEPGVLSPATSRGSSIKSRSPHLFSVPEQSGRFSPHISGSNTSSPQHAQKFSFDQGKPETYQKVDDTLPFSKAWHNPNDRAGSGLDRSNTTHGPSNIYDQDRANLALSRSNTLAHKPSNNQMARGTLQLVPEAPPGQIKIKAPTLAGKPSFDQIGRGTPTISSIFPGIDGRYHPGGNKSPESQANYAKLPTRSSSLARRTVSSNPQISTLSANTEYLHPRPPPLPREIASRDSHRHDVSKPQNPDYMEYGNYDVRYQYSQSKYSQYPSQIQGNTDFENFGLDAYPISPVQPMPGFDYNSTAKSNITSSSVPIAMYPNAPDEATALTFAQPLPSANHSPALASFLPSQSNDSELHTGQNQNTFISSQNEYNESMYEEPQYHNNRVSIQYQDQDQDTSQEHRPSQSSGSMEYQRAVRRITVWDGTQEFTDSRCMPIIEENPREMKREIPKEQKMAKEKDFDFSNFWSDLSRI